MGCLLGLFLALVCAVLMAGLDVLVSKKLKVQGLPFRAGLLIYGTVFTVALLSTAAA